MDLIPLKGKNAIVKGGSRGIGQAIALGLPNRGATVLITYITSTTGADKPVSTIKAAGGKAHATLADFHAAQVSADFIVSEAIKFFPDGHIDIIVNNAADGEARPLEDIDTEFFDRVIHANVLLPLLLLKAGRGVFEEGGEGGEC